MRIYMNGTLSKKQECFLPSAIYLANDKADDNDIASENCIQLEGLECECSHEGLEWSVRWKGVTLANEKEFDEDFTKEQVLALIKERNLKLANMDAYISNEAEVTVESISILDGEWGTQTYLEKEFPGILDEKIIFEGF